MTNGFQDNALHINKKYGIEMYTCAEDEFNALRDVIENKMAATETWKREWLDDHLLRRFLRTFETVEESAAKITDYFNWRHAEAIDDIDVNEPIMAQLMAQGTNEILENFYDRCGRPIMIIHTARQTKEADKSEQIFKRAMWHIEQMCKRCDACALRNFTIVFNMNNFTMGNSDYTFLQRYVNALRDFYPERIGAGLVINYPPIVYPVWKVAKFWMNKHLRSRFIFCGKAEFNDFIDVENMPVKLFD